MPPTFPAPAAGLPNGAHSSLLAPTSREGNGSRRCFGALPGVGAGALKASRLACALALGAVLVGCAGSGGRTEAPLRPFSPVPQLAKAATESEVIGILGRPTHRYAMPEGQTRLEFARGPLGYETWMVDLSAEGRVLRFEQVLNERRFGDVTLNMSEQDLLRLLGRPAERQREYMDRETWYWRYDAYDCLLFAVTFNPKGRVMHTGSRVPDPRCDATQ
jgi:hypothetical protein